MITQKQDNDLQQGNQAPSPTKEHRWRDRLLSTLGVVMSLVAGSMVSWPWGVGDIFDAEWILNTVVVATGLLALVGAFLLRSKWALLIVPAAWIGGELLGAVVRPLVEGGWTALQAEVHFWDVQRVIVPMGVAFVFIWTILGTGLGKWLKARLQGG